MLKIFKRGGDRHSGWSRYWTAHGIDLIPGVHKDSIRLDDPYVQGLLTQLSDDGLAVETTDGFSIDWDALYLALDRPEYAGLPKTLSLPDFTDLLPILVSRHGLTDPDFAISISGWYRAGEGVSDWTLMGPVMTNRAVTRLMTAPHWRLAREIFSFARRSADQHDDASHRRAWGHIRHLARDADARLDDFLYRTVVLTPDKLRIGLRKSDHVKNDHVIEIEPGFSEAPSGWLTAFDGSSKVRDRYDIATAEGIVQVLITPKIRTVLEEIKRYPGRRVAGSRAEAFILNPYATLGDDAVDVIEEQQFEQARDDAGLLYERFSPIYERDVSGRPIRIGLLVESASSGGPTSSESHWLNDDDLTAFLTGLKAAIATQRQLLAWQGYDLEIQGDAQRIHDELAVALFTRQTPPVLVSYADIHDLSFYSARIEDIGKEKPYYSPYIAKKKDDTSWFPDNIQPMIVYQPDDANDPIAVPASVEAIEDLRRSVEAAEASGAPAIQVTWLPESIKVDEARRIVNTVSGVMREAREKGEFDPEVERRKAATVEPAADRKQLILRANILSVEYEESRRETLTQNPGEPQLPSALKPQISLYPHQREGVAWMQHLYGLRDECQVRGAVLAHDMGLGKTLQLLCLMAWLLEQDAKAPPVLIVAPVSLLENWADEIASYFCSGSLPFLMAYGDKLRQLRVPRAQIDQRLQTEDGLVKFLKPGWVGDARIVLTTYETLRDLEFSFAAQKWSLMVCDEAQRVKNPAAMVTRAAKKQNAFFKIACTGTPVENTLADLWCLFDFIQPGLLGALNDFGQRYRKPIEARTDEERARVEELRQRIAPQILRRLKKDVAQDLPKKIVSPSCRQLPLSATQRNLYANAINSFKNRDESGQPMPFKSHLGLLHYLRLICTDPRPHGLGVFKPEPERQYRDKAPKLDWLLGQLQVIKGKSEKAIVFCEFREIQRLLQHYIEGNLGIRADIINGDTSASSSHAASRQKRIKVFQNAPGFGVLILSPVAVGFGVNIQAANHVIHYTRTWNPAKEDQATDRAYRIGQTKDVYVYYPVVHAEDFTTFDVKLDQLLEHKRQLAEDMLNGAGDVGPSDFNLPDLVSDADRDGIDKRVTIDTALRMEWQHLECLVAAIWARRGYVCTRTPDRNDNGVDIVAIKGGTGALIQVKSSGNDGASLGWDAVKDVVTGEAFYCRQYPGVEFAKICVTNQFFSSQAIENAVLNDVELLNRKDLSHFLAVFPVTMNEVDSIRYSTWE
jgi:hypothetical protein